MIIVKFIGCVLVGFAITFVGMSMCLPESDYGSGVEQTGSILGLSIICTYGMGLLGWIPRWFVVGWLTLAPFRFFVEKPATKEEPALPVPSVNLGVYCTTASEGHRTPRNGRAEEPAVERPLLSYMIKARDLGMSDARIDQRCRENGWSEADIQNARRLSAGR
jgi:hypothetical protein